MTCFLLTVIIGFFFFFFIHQLVHTHVTNIDRLRNTYMFICKTYEHTYVSVGSMWKWNKSEIFVLWIILYCFSLIPQHAEDVRDFILKVAIGGDVKVISTWIYWNMRGIGGVSGRSERQFWEWFVWLSSLLMLIVVVVPGVCWNIDFFQPRLWCFSDQKTFIYVLEGNL